MMADDYGFALNERDERLARAREAFSGTTPRPDIFPKGVRKFRSLYEMKADRDQRIIDWYLSRDSAS